MDSTQATEPLGYLDEAAISAMLAVLAPTWDGRGMLARGDEERARVALRTFLLRARTPTNV